MPLFEGYAGGVSTLLMLDSGPAQLVNLTRVGSEPTTYAVRWSATGLTNETHTLINSPGVSATGQQAGWGEVNAFMYVLVQFVLLQFYIYPQLSYTVAEPSPASFNVPVIAGATVGGVAGLSLLILAFLNSHHLGYLLASLVRLFPFIY